VNLYERKKGEWVKTVLDDSIKANSCEVVDFNGDKKPDIACIGGSTSNLKVFVAK